MTEHIRSSPSAADMFLYVFRRITVRVLTNLSESVIIIANDISYFMRKCMTYSELAEELLQLMVKSPYMKIIRELGKTTRPEIFVLMYLRTHGGRAYPKELSDAFLVSTARVAVILNRLESEGYVRRLADTADNRHTVVEMTDAGHRLMANRRSEVIARLTGILELLDPDDAAEYIRLQKKITEAAANMI